MSYFSRTITPILTSTVPELLIYSVCGASNLQAEFGSEPIAGKENEKEKKKATHEMEFGSRFLPATRG